MIVTVSGKTYSAALDPQATGVPKEMGLPVPTKRRVGRGLQHDYDIGTHTALAVYDHLACLADCFASVSWDDDGGYSQAEARAIRKDMKRMRDRDGGLPWENHGRDS